jgi:hypothetical protein
MPKRYGGLNKLRKKAEKDRSAGKDGQTSAAIASWENVKARWEEMKGNQHRRGSTHTPESLRKMSESHKERWRDPKFADKMWKIRRARQFREKGKCLLRFPRWGRSSEEQEWLDAYRKSYSRITGEHLRESDIILYRESN